MALVLLRRLGARRGALWPSFSLCTPFSRATNVYATAYDPACRARLASSCRPHIHLAQAVGAGQCRPHWHAGPLAGIERCRRAWEASNRRAVSSDVGSVEVGDVSVPVGPRESRSAALVPGPRRGWESAYVYGTAEATHHLRWMMQKEKLGQDMLLIGPPSSIKRALAFEFCSLLGRPVQYVPITRDTVESDLKQQRRELVDGTSLYVDQAAVTAALEGHVLVLDGLEKAERNLLPVLNNLLENREMRLEDGRFLVHRDVFETLKETTSEAELKRYRIFPTHSDFRVIALTLPVPPYSGITLDPPLRSRFQGRYIARPSAGAMLDALQSNGLRGSDVKAIASFEETILQCTHLLKDLRGHHCI